MKESILFNVVQRDVRYIPHNKAVNWPASALPKSNEHKLLLREDTQTPLAVVGRGYKVIQNQELYEDVEHKIEEVIGPTTFENAIVDSSTAYGGAQCFREYVFPDIQVKTPTNGDVSFRILVHNTFGAGSLKVIGGAFILVCTNGLIIGERDTRYFRHTKGLQIPKVTEHIEWLHHKFVEVPKKWEEWSNTRLSNNTLMDFLYHHFPHNTNKNECSRRGNLIEEEYADYAAKDGYTIWSLYNALTAWSSGSSSRFKLRETKHDHAAATLLDQQREVARIVANDNIIFNRATA